MNKYTRLKEFDVSIQGISHLSKNRKTQRGAADLMGHISLINTILVNILERSPRGKFNKRALKLFSKKREKAQADVLSNLIRGPLFQHHSKMLIL